MDDSDAIIRVSQVRGRRCPQCSGGSKVVDVRHTPLESRRRRECLECGRRWTSRERDDDEKKQATLWLLIHALERAYLSRNWSALKAARKALEAEIGKRPPDLLVQEQPPEADEVSL